MAHNYIMVKSIDHLNNLIENEQNSFFILLNCGFTSSKDIFFGDEPDTYFVINEIDDTEETLTREQLFDKNCTNIGEALKSGALYNYGI